MVTCVVGDIKSCSCCRRIFSCSKFAQCHKDIAIDHGRDIAVTSSSCSQVTQTATIGITLDKTTKQVDCSLISSLTICNLIR